jgi:hypothetical protein
MLLVQSTELGRQWFAVASVAMVKGRRWRLGVEFQEVVGAVLYIGGSYVLMRRDSSTDSHKILIHPSRISFGFWKGIKPILVRYDTNSNLIESFNPTVHTRVHRSGGYG